MKRNIFLKMVAGVLATFVFISTAVSATVKSPDFAYPAKVVKDSRARLDAALSSGRYADALTALLENAVAEARRSSTGTDSSIALMDSAYNHLPRPYSGVVELMKANLYTAQYSSDSWTYSKRTLPLTDVPGSCLEWSRDIFLHRVTELCDSALSLTSGYGDEKLSILGGAVTFHNEMPQGKSRVPKAPGEVEFTLSDFTASVILECLAAFDCHPGRSEDSLTIPFFPRSADKEPGVQGEAQSLADRVLDTWLESASRHPGTVPAVLAAIRKADTMNESEKAPWLYGKYQEWSAYPASLYLLNPFNNACTQLIENARSGEGKSSEDIPSWATPEARYRLFQNALKAHPGSFAAPGVSNIITTLTAPSLRGTLPATAMPGREIMAVVTSENVTEGKFAVIRVPAGEENGVDTKTIRSSGKVVRTFDVKFDRTVPFRATDTISIGSLDPGTYVILSSTDGSLRGALGSTSGNRVYDVMTVSAITGLSVTTGRKTNDLFFVVRLSDQQPVEGATVQAYKRDYRLNSRNGLVSLGTVKSATDGSVPLPAETSYVRVIYGDELYQGNVRRGWDRTSDEGGTQASVYVERAIARPGDSVKFAVVAWSYKNMRNTLQDNHPLDVVLNDASYQPVDTISVVTDEWGRATGEFTIPEGRMNGHWSIVVKEKDAPRYGTLGATTLRVEEYHLPTFTVTLDRNENPAADDSGNLVLEGKAATFSGMPVADARVEISVVTRNPYWRMWGGYIPDGRCTMRTRTSADGTFRILISPDSIKGTQYADSGFRLTATVTDNAGETQEAPGYDFSFAKGFSLAPEIASRTEITGGDVLLNVTAIDAAGLPAVRDAICRVSGAQGNDTPAFEIPFTTPRLIIPADRLPSGKYNLTLRLAEDKEGRSGSAREVETIFYRADERTAPSGTLLWLPKTRILSDSEETVVPVTVGSDSPGNWLLCEISDLEGNSAFKWVKTGKENVTFDVDAPSENGTVWVNVCAMRDMKWTQGSVEIIPRSLTESVEVETETFRPAISAGDREVWKFRFRKGSVPVRAAVMAAMTDFALNSLQPLVWRAPGTAFDRFGRVSLSISSSLGATLSFSKRFNALRYKTQDQPVNPQFYTWGYSLSPERVYPLMMKRALTGAVSRGDGVTEGYAVVEDEMADFAAPMANGVMMTEAAAAPVYGMAEEEKAEETADAGGASGDEQPESNVPLRPSELPVAFFMPMLESDADGLTEVRFEVPDFNTTWQFRIMGYDEEVEGAVKVMETVASKKVMARLNAPRFMRTGDRALLAATLYNNTESPLSVSGRIDVLGADGKMIATRKYKGEKLPASGSRVITLELTAPSDMMNVSVRAYAYGDDHSDGEESIIPVMPSSEPVVESVPFWLAPGTETFEITLPKFEKGSMLTLNYCDNPAWTCLTALPALTSPDSDNALSLSCSLFGNGTAIRLLGSSATLREGLSSMLSSGDEAGSPLTSPLERNGEVKSVALMATPWLPDAQGETERMRSLGALLDSVEARRVITATAQRLASLQNADGSWSWCKGMPGSVWMTRQVVTDLAPASDMCGFADEELGGMVKRGVAYVDHALLEEYLKRSRKGESHPFGLVEMNRWLLERRGAAGDVKVKASGWSDLVRDVIATLEKDWNTLGIYDRATAALNLHYSGRETAARAILESLASTALTSPEKGMWFDTLEGDYTSETPLVITARVLEAYAAVSPDAPQVDMLRQWLVMQRQVQDWGRTLSTAPVVRAILSTGTDWTLLDLPAPEIRLRGRRVDSSSVKAPGGCLSIDLNPSDASGAKLSVSRTSGSPAWGGVVSARIAPVKDVKAASIPPLSVEKNVYLIDNEGNASRAAELNVGDRVSVTITVVCDRDMDYVAITDSRAACLEPVKALSGYTLTDGVGCYMDVRTAATNLFFDRLPKGTHVFSYDCRVMEAGEFAAGVATVQSQYSPLMTARSAGVLLKVK
ncbi:MAG: hypothetical protein K2O24_03250 [Muribaculaceae bacterium]|nr:hypothetical protein [Muribaculaceae bacterium]